MSKRVACVDLASPNSFCKQAGKPSRVTIGVVKMMLEYRSRPIGHLHSYIRQRTSAIRALSDGVNSIVPGVIGGMLRNLSRGPSDAKAGSILSVLLKLCCLFHIRLLRSFVRINTHPGEAKEERTTSCLRQC